jgi:hypothetical protein
VFYKAPSENLKFPDWGVITASEFIVFAPNWLRSIDPVFRLVSNGLTSQIAAIMHEHYRHLDSSKTKAIDRTTFTHIIRKAMRDHGYDITTTETINGQLVPVVKPWTIGQHVQHGMKDWFGPWDEEDLSVAVLRVQCEHDLGKKSGDLVDNIPTASLANGVKRFPSLETGDGMDLTRSVEIAVANQDLDLQFPRDFEPLTKLLPLIRVEPKHFDGAAFERFKKGKVPTPMGPIPRTAHIRCHLQHPSSISYS